MIVTTIFLAGGAYSTDSEGNTKVIIIDAGATESVMLMAFCCDFEKDNPSSADFFMVSSIPSLLKVIAGKIVRYMASHVFDSNLSVKAVQLAVWRSQGESREDISEKFLFTDEDWDLSTTIMNT
jgi:hypothetical protein